MDRKMAGGGKGWEDHWDVHHNKKWDSVSLRDEECGLVFSILIPGPLRSNYTSFPANITAMSTSFRAQIYSMVSIAI